ncbi:Desmocollin-1 [Frankliniella fusca]|uniref:Desmocollin-1 n=1 Tax=Frankliniella fusca TaxID=407009 RepID=A0AAE1L770_9NEOP|nr:Desmocollin-1 [Frankliniella fusca]
MGPFLLRGPAIILRYDPKLHLVQRVTGAAIERWDFHLLLYKADMGPFVSLWRKILPVPGHLIAGTPLKRITFSDALRSPSSSAP